MFSSSSSSSFFSITCLHLFLSSAFPLYLTFSFYLLFCRLLSFPLLFLRFFVLSTLFFFFLVIFSCHFSFASPVFTHLPVLYSSCCFIQYFSEGGMMGTGNLVCLSVSLSPFLYCNCFVLNIIIYLLSFSIIHSSFFSSFALHHHSIRSSSTYPSSPFPVFLSFPFLHPSLSTHPFLLDPFLSFLPNISLILSYFPSFYILLSFPLSFTANLLSPSTPSFPSFIPLTMLFPPKLST